MASAVAILLLALVPLLPRALADGDPAALVGLPGESILVLALLCLLPWRLARGVLATGFAIVVVVAILLAGIDAGYRSALDIPFDPLEWPQLGDAFGVLEGSVGAGAARGVIVLLALVAVGLVLVLSFAALRVGTALRRRVRGQTMIAAFIAAWTVIALTGSQLAGQPAAPTASVQAIGESVDHAADGLAAAAELSRQIATDPYRDAPRSDLLTALQGKDVVFAFVESYGRVAVEGDGFSDGVRQVLRDGEAQLRVDGYTSRTAFLTSPTFGGLSWLAHSTFHTGLWVDRQTLYSKVMRSGRLTLSAAFGEAGWRTVGVIPSNTEPWPLGASFYRWDTMLDVNDLGYRGPRFGYARVPDQYTWTYVDDQVLADDSRPIMAEVDLVSSHSPWTPLPELVPSSDVDDSSVYEAQFARGESATELWQDPERVRRAYAASIEYSLGATFAFLHERDDPDLVLVVLGDHQPMAAVSGRDAGHDVPISIIAKDPAVFESIEGWQWPDGMLPDADAPVWPMSAFRDRFLDAFSAR
ncbi:hypothetical protein BCL57_003219 [Agromyces flavus]|uniref:Phosphoglycerol transferase MdoB n=1 Tax=Agromyces flavus TaxID=589382 RepID=A0ABT1KQ66_9MICO|nr:hypothetical protein [Agromyces flavus]MCP2369040.1 hypothetical protein [Agromyces flavus]GGI48495.1 hypothetical protein GCM10010932_31830 [Agromyces flavus]